MKNRENNYVKNFDEWSKAKKELDDFVVEKYAHPREVWWCSLGVNIGAEIDGKNENFERPVVVMNVYNKETMLVLPLTSKLKDDEFHFKIDSKEKIVYAKLTQARVISSKRLLRKVDMLDDESFEELRSKWKELL